ncbi:MAG: glycoside hydrolase family 16 protein [Flavobacterium sp.]|nr:glycoside hydrolase family 16 protein [Pedobacter sp.]
MKKLLIAIIGIVAISCSQKKDLPVPAKPPVVPRSSYSFESTAVWVDEFDVPGKPDVNKWGYDLGGHGWGNNELQNYTSDNANIENGILTITAKKESLDNNSYTSSRMVTKGKGDFLYGRFEISAKLPTGKGTWPAIWMLPTDWTYGNWPNSGEIDIMEHVGYDQNKVHITVHTGSFNHSINTQKGNFLLVPTASTEFHKYRVDWTPLSIKGYIDDNLVFNFDNNGQGFMGWPFDKRFHLLLNIAVGGNWGGAQGVEPLAFPASMEVDYVRVFKLVESK